MAQVTTSAQARKLLEATARAEATADQLLDAEHAAQLAAQKLATAEQRAAEPADLAKRRADAERTATALRQAEAEHRKAQAALSEQQGQQAKRAHEEHERVAATARAEHERAYVQPLAAAVLQVLRLAEAERGGRAKLQDQLARDFAAADLPHEYPSRFVSDVAELFPMDRYGRCETQSALEVYLAELRSAGYTV
jgi:hypothetical protein